MWDVVEGVFHFCFRCKITAQQKFVGVCKSNRVKLEATGKLVVLNKFIIRL